MNDGNPPSEGDYLTPEERTQLQRLFSSPEEFPREFGAWIKAYMEVNGEVLRSQVVGLQRFTAKQDVDSTTSGGTIAASTYGNLTPATEGVALSGLSEGTYLIMFGAEMGAGVAGKTCYMSISVNGAAAVDGDAVFYYNGPGPSFSSAGVMRATLKTLSLPNNTITAKYRSQDTTTCTFIGSWLVALRIA